MISRPPATESLVALARALLSDTSSAPSATLADLLGDSTPATAGLAGAGVGAAPVVDLAAAGLAPAVGLATVGPAPVVDLAAVGLGTAIPFPAFHGRPTGLGTSAAWLRPNQPEPATGATAAKGDDDLPELFCPGPARDDPALGELVNDRLVIWAEEMGIYAGRLDHLRSCNFGRLMMLTHPAVDDPDRLLAATQVVVAEWAADDYYLDEEEMGADPRLTSARLGLIYGMVDPAALPGAYQPQLDDFVRDEPIARAFRSGMRNLARYTTGAQMGRFQHQMAILFTTLGQNASWRVSGARPAVWEYLVHRHHNSYLPPMILVDALAGYELSAEEFYHPRVRRAFTMAGLAAVLINDLNSAGKEADDDLSLPEAIVAEEGCTRKEAIRRTIEIHNELMRGFVAEAGALSLVGTPNLRRFFADTWAWCGGSREWHATTRRYHSEA
ncbi:family 2 encapsulin nanocompartment cargo protein terpene cyclase [Longispora fulva]|uniref:family 2 encapsulin nanocompartment cargo protein terpene cyclase n=1 Tax=Longispora fulva TaxID=619741 RepID=UPI001F307106|nr:family 2 encapsulin nanocompartment cargo protein terpene cyclase [Longispora fulva]